MHSLRAELDKCYPENEKLRRLLRDSDEIRKNITIPTVTQSVATIETTDTKMPVSSYVLNFDEREKSLHDENNSLKQVRIMEIFS